MSREHPSKKRICVLRLDREDEDGTFWGHIHQQKQASPTEIMLATQARHGGAATLYDLVLVRLEPQEDAPPIAHGIRTLNHANNKQNKPILGIIEEAGKGGLLTSVGKGKKHQWRIAASEMNGAQAGELVEAHPIPTNAPVGRRGRELALPKARIIKRFGRGEDYHHFSQIAEIERELPDQFPESVLKQAQDLPEFSPNNKDYDRTDLRHIPFVTIDGEDARDFDDAIAAEPVADHSGFFTLYVAIADVAHYVEAGSPLDIEAQKRGNSVYFPDRVIPMLPERLSNDLCSLRPDLIRPVVCAILTINSHGKLVNSEFKRAMICSRARLTYSKVEQILFSDSPPKTSKTNALKTPLQSLKQVWQLLAAERAQRQALELVTQEMGVVFADNGTLQSIAPRVQLNAHKLVEECMIAANVAVSKTLAKAKRSFLYRVHEPPPLEKFDVLKQTLIEQGVRAGSIQPTTRWFNSLLKRCENETETRQMSELILRSQSQAVYQPQQEGHFGLALTHYCHFTSPIRRYADLYTHRALIAFLSNPKKANETFDQQLIALGEQLSLCERRAQIAERDTLARFMAYFLKDQVGATFTANVTGVQPFGLFVELQQIGAEGLTAYPFHRYLRDKNRNMRNKRNYKRGSKPHSAKDDQELIKHIPYKIGDEVQVRLIEVAPLQEGLRFALLNVKRI